MDSHLLGSWARLHSVTPQWVAAAIAAPFAAALLCHMGLPAMMGGEGDGWETMQVVGMGMTAVVGPTFAMPLVATHPWVYSAWRARLVWVRAGWFLALGSALVLLSSFAGVAVLPGTIPVFSGFVMTCLLWWAVAACLITIARPAVAFSLPLLVVGAHLVRFVPWRANLLFNPDLVSVRAGLTCSLVGVAWCTYAIRGSREIRRGH